MDHDVIIGTDHYMPILDLRRLDVPRFCSTPSQLDHIHNSASHGVAFALKTNPKRTCTVRTILGERAVSPPVIQTHRTDQHWIFGRRGAATEVQKTYLSNKK